MARRLIDEIALSGPIQSEYHGAISDSEMKVYQVLQRLESAPTVDAVPVVRCRECTAFEQKGKYPAGMPYGYCYHWEYERGMSPNQVDGNDFCSYGERKEE